MKMWSLLQLADDRSVYGEKKERGIYIEGGRQRSRGINVDSAREEKKQLVPPEIHHGRANNKEMEISILRVCISIYLSISKHPPAVDRNLPVCWSERSKLIQKKRFLFLDMFIKPYIFFLVKKKKKLFPSLFFVCFCHFFFASIKTVYRQTGARCHCARNAKAERNMYTRSVTRSTNG